MGGTIRFRRPEVADTEAAIRHYYGTGYIGNKEMREIFGERISKATLAKLKKVVRTTEEERNIPEVVPHKVNAEVAYEVWGIDTEKLVRNRQKLIKLGLL